MSYDPFVRGPSPVGVASTTFVDGPEARTLALELWYPASDAHAGQDLDPEKQDRYKVAIFAPEAPQEAVRNAEPADGRFPLVCFSHGWGGHRRQTTHLCTHLASHGFAVASVDHAGNTIEDMMKMLGTLSSGASGAPAPEEVAAASMRQRRLDIPFAIDRVRAGEAGIPGDRVGTGQVGLSGHSFGGWTTLAVAGDDPRVGCALPLAPAGGTTPLSKEVSALEDSLTFDWDREIPTLLLAADRDTLLPLAGMRGLFGRVPKPKDMWILERADHMHFCDRVEETHEMFRMLGGMAAGLPGGGQAGAMTQLLESVAPVAELCPGADAYAFIQGLGLAHMDAHLRDDRAAASWLAGQAAAELEKRGVAAERVSG